MKTARIAFLASALVGLGALAGLSPTHPGPLATPALGAAYEVDPVHSTLVFKVGHNAGTFFGRFNKISGSFLLDGAGALEFTVQTDSVDTGIEKRDLHLKSPDFFNVKQFPTSTFKSTSVKKTGEGAYEAAGDLTLGGTTKPVTVKIASARTGTNPQSKQENAGFEATIAIKRSDFGISKFTGMLGEDVTIMVGVEGNR